MTFLHKRPGAVIRTYNGFNFCINFLKGAYSVKYGNVFHIQLSYGLRLMIGHRINLWPFSEVVDKHHCITVSIRCPGQSQHVHSSLWNGPSTSISLSRVLLGQRDSDPDSDQLSGDEWVPGVTIPVVTIATSSDDAEGEQILDQEVLLTDVTNVLPEISQEQCANSYFAEIIQYIKNGRVTPSRRKSGEENCSIPFSD